MADWLVVVLAAAVAAGCVAAALLIDAGLRATDRRHGPYGRRRGRWR